ncbi:MAG: hypothetical protein P1U57_04735 [Oleibacter sp.]|nr:hypothetical protein [Thalassolituus sp.]
MKGSFRMVANGHLGYRHESVFASYMPDSQLLCKRQKLEGKEGFSDLLRDSAHQTGYVLS